MRAADTRFPIAGGCVALIYVFIFGSVAVFGITAVAGLVWALRTGQMRHFAAGAATIFDDDEPIGQMTDRFPDGEEPSDSGAEEAGGSGR